MRISDWSSYVCSSVLTRRGRPRRLSSRLRPQRFHQRHERGEAGRDRPGVVDDHRPVCGKAKHGKAHRDAVIQMAGDGRAACQLFAAGAVDDQTVLQLLDRKSVVSGKSVSVRVELGGSSIIKKNTRITEKSQKRRQT